MEVPSHQDSLDSDLHHTANLLASAPKAPVANLEPVQEQVATLPRQEVKPAKAVKEPNCNNHHLSKAVKEALVDSAQQVDSAVLVVLAFWVLRSQLQFPDH